MCEWKQFHVATLDFHIVEGTVGFAVSHTGTVNTGSDHRHPALLLLLQSPMHEDPAQHRQNAKYHEYSTNMNIFQRRGTGSLD
jgi:hypothetical protein